MITNKINKQIVLEKKNQLETAFRLLNHEFIGLEKVLGELENSLTPWFIFPQAQLRPTVINLWGLTGSGKTALIKRLIELLDLKNNYVHLDMGEYESDSSSWIKAVLTSDLAHLDGKPAVLCFDEFQFARTINEDRKELGKDKLRVIWDIIDSGKVTYTPEVSAYYIFRAEECIEKLTRCKEKGLEVAEGKVIGDEKIFSETMKGFYFESENRNGAMLNADYLNSSDFLEGMYYLFNIDQVTREMVQEKIQAANITGLIKLLNEGLATRTANRVLDLSHSLVFILGNLDEAFPMSHITHPDTDADALHESSKKISLTEVKSALQRRFRNEQIARMGNNHIIYTSFSKQHFQLFISRQLQRISNYFKEEYGFEIRFSKSVEEIIYKEGVYPSQGMRPVLTTIHQLIEGKAARLCVEVFTQAHATGVIEWEFENEKFIFRFKDSSENELYASEEKTELKIETLRKSTGSELQAHTAVHEAGHAVTAALSLRLIPSVIYSKTASSDADGFCMVTLPEDVFTRDILQKQLMIGLSGYIAEQMIFGEENTSDGVCRDIERVSRLAHKAIKEYAMGNDPIRSAVIGNNSDEEFIHDQQREKEALELVKSCYTMAENLLEKNKLLLLKMSEYLCVNSKMEEPTIKEYIMRYTTEEWAQKGEFRTKQGYFQFAAAIQNKITELASETELTK